jgi:hypothetical protein
VSIGSTAAPSLLKCLDNTQKAAMAREASKQGDGLINGADDDVILDALGLKSKGVNGAQAKNSYKYWALQGKLKRA